nr:hypothetical protein [Sphingobium algorifonticola]
MPFKIKDAVRLVPRRSVPIVSRQQRCHSPIPLLDDGIAAIDCGRRRHAEAVARIDHHHQPVLRMIDMASFDASRFHPL